MIYLDYAASAPPFEACAALVQQVMCAAYANPGALHRAGGNARQLLQESRRTLAGLLNVRDREVFFTSGGTEANNWAVKLGCLHGRGKEILVFAAEHKSVLESAYAMEAQGYRVKLLYPDSTGQLPPEALEKAIGPDTALLCVQAVNNETGAVQDVEALARIAKTHHVPFLCDAVQSFGHLSQPLHKADFITLSAHKFDGPRGVGCLVARYPYTPQPLIHGGGQELGLRSGTENLPGIAGMALAAELSLKQLPDEQTRLETLSALLLEGLRQADPCMVLNGDGRRHPAIVNCRFPGISAEEMVMRLDLQGICVSPGAACAARDPQPSHVLLAMGFSETHARESLRFSLGRNTTEAEIQQTIRAVGAIVRSRRKEH